MDETTIPSPEQPPTSGSEPGTGSGAPPTPPGASEADGGAARGPYQLPPTRRPLLRSRDDRVVAGVCAALGRYTDVDPVIYRVTFAVLTIFGGAGLVLYVLGWLVIPEQGAPGSVADRLLRSRPGSRPSVPVLIGIGLAVVILAGIVSNNGGAGLALVIVAGIALLASRAASSPAATPPPGWGAPTAAYGPTSQRPTTELPPYPPGTGALPYAGYAGPPAYSPYGVESAYGLPPADAGAHPVAARGRPRSVLGMVTASIAVVAVAVLLLIANLTGMHLSVAGVLATALVVVGLGLLVGTWLGRSRWLIALGALLTAATLTASAVSAISVPMAGGTGNRNWAPVSTAELRPSYELGAGDATLDLSRLTGLDGRHVEARVGLGQLKVLVPRDVDVTVHGKAGAGNLTLFGDDRAGRGLDRRVSDPGIGSTGSIDLDLKVGVGQVEVDRVSP